MLLRFPASRTPPAWELAQFPFHSSFAIITEDFDVQAQPQIVFASLAPVKTSSNIHFSSFTLTTHMAGPYFRNLKPHYTHLANSCHPFSTPLFLHFVFSLTSYPFLSVHQLWCSQFSRGRHVNKLQHQMMCNSNSSMSTYSIYRWHPERKKECWGVGTVV